MILGGVTDRRVDGCEDGQRPLDMRMDIRMTIRSRHPPMPLSKRVSEGLRGSHDEAKLQDLRKLQ